ncbi:MAG: DUF2809 domain-containing protein [Lachnospiraceae bacterium]|nr:DUF2809 domain-containing protein [Lachnospiraceae bacterium]
MRRLFYLAATCFLLIIEVLIALYVHDGFIRPYIGDVLVVMVLYTFVRIWLPDGVRLLPLYIFVLAVCVELLQKLRIVELLGLADNTFFRVLIGSVFDVKDMICYAVGCALLAIYEVNKSC